MRKAGCDYNVSINNWSVYTWVIAPWGGAWLYLGRLKTGYNEGASKNVIHPKNVHAGAYPLPSLRLADYKV